ncbi:DUF4276 family protein [Aquimarina megaterium]|uniref:DUF4276 family protein n=1 Tax=Aquimarina megaterium TaxID=1443666 RepID=UPI000471EDFA|nr:DUF4276 family protein [Aquimarina megaterium]
MSITKNQNSILFLYEGETEKEFYNLFLNKYIERRKIRTNFGNLNGVYDINNKVESKIKSYLANSKFSDCNQIHVFVAYDREGDRNTDTLLNIKELNKNFSVGDKKSRIISINEIVATQDLESWLFYDLKNIYSFLRVPNSQRNLKAYPNCEAVNNKTLSTLFHRFGKHYQKGKRVRNFIESLDLEIIYNNVQELQNAVTIMRSLY